MNVAKTMNFSLLMQRKKTLLFSGICVAGIAFMISKVLPYQYIGEGGLVVETPIGAGVAAAADEGTSVVQTQIDVLQSKGLLTRVVQNFHLTADQIEPQWRLPKPIIDAAENSVQWIKDNGHALLGDTPRSVPDPIEHTVDVLQKHLVVSAKTGSKLINVRFYGGSSQMAAAVVKGIMDTYTSADSNLQQNRIDKVNDQIAEQTEAMTTDLNAAKRKVSEYVRAHNLPETQGGTVAAGQLAKDQEALAAARQQAAVWTERAETLRKFGADASEEALENPVIINYRNQEATLTSQIALLGPLDGRRLALQQAINSIHQKIVDQTKLIALAVDRNVMIAQSKVFALSKAVQEDLAASQTVSDSSVTLKQLQAAVDLKQAALLAYDSQAGALRQAAQTAPSAHVNSAAVAQTRPVNSYSMISIFLGFMCGIAGAGGTILLRDVFGTRITTTLELQMATNMRPFGALPDMKQLSDGTITAAKPNAVATVVETFRRLWLDMRPLSNDRGTTAVVTSSEVGEGKTLTAAALAQRFAEDGHRVLLIEADLRRPTLAKVLKATPRHYLESVLGLTGPEIALTDAVCRVPTSKDYSFDCLMSNGRVRNPVGVLVSEEFREIVDRAREAYEFVFMDSPPVMHVSDPTQIAELSDHILFVVRAGRVTNEVVYEATRHFDEEARKKMFIFLTQVKPDKRDPRDAHRGYTGSGDASFNLEQIGHDV